MSLNVFGSISEKWMSVREKNIKLLREAITYMATTGTPTSIITTEKVMCIMHCRKYAFTCINAAETSNCIIATEIATCVIATKRSTNIIIVESATDIIVIEPQNLNNCKTDVGTCIIGIA